MKISVIIPTYRPQDYLYECLDSLCNQTVKKESFEVIIVLNGCNEPFKTTLQSYIKEHDEVNILFIQTNIGGVSLARNLALDKARGEYITFIDDDDYVSPTYLEELLFKSSHDTIALCYPLQFNDGTKDYKPYYITGNYTKYATLGKQDYKNADSFFSGPVYKLIHRDIIGGRRFDCRFKNGEDTLFMFLISDRFKYIDFTSKNAVYYRRLRSGSETQTKKPVMYIVENRIKLIREFTKIYSSNVSNYSFGFYLNFVMGSFKAMIYNILKHKCDIKNI